MVFVIVGGFMIDAKLFACRAEVGLSSMSSTAAAAVAPPNIVDTVPVAIGFVDTAPIDNRAVCETPARGGRT